MSPIFVAAMQPTGRGRWTCRVAGEPIRNDVVVELLAPEQPSRGLAYHAPLGLAKLHSGDRLVILVGLADARREHRLRVRRLRGALMLVKEPQRFARSARGCVTCNAALSHSLLD